MPLDTISVLLNGRDNFEFIRRRIGEILVAERDNQMQLATDAGEDPQQWNMRVFEERSNPWAEAISQSGPRTPIVNVWFDSSTTDEKSSVRANQQKFNGSFNVDIYGFGVTTKTQSGQEPGDLAAADACQRTASFVRNFFMASHNTYLQTDRQSDQFAWDRRVEGFQSFQPRNDQNPAVTVVALRLRLGVSFNEYSPQYQGVPLAELHADVFRAENGELLLRAQYDYQP